MIPKRWLQFSISDTLVCMAALSLFAYANTFQFNVGSGFWIVQQGLPLPFYTDHSMYDAPRYDFLFLGIDVLVGLSVAAISVGVFRSVKVIWMTQESK